jgi:hypothetical protein
LTELLAFAESLTAPHAGDRGQPDRHPRIFGFSGGAQFAHRYILRGSPVDRLAICAPGYFTMPDPETDYPYGSRTGKQPPVDPRWLASTPTRVFVGSRDTERDRDLRTSKRLDRQQGNNRVERAQRFVTTMRAFSCQQGLLPTTTLSILEGSHHSFGSYIDAGLASRVLQFLYPETTIHPTPESVPAETVTGETATGETVS